jgi:hypothetical protein
MAATSVPATVHIKRSHFLGVILAVAALAAALTWAIVSLVVDDPPVGRAALVARPGNVTASEIVPVRNRPFTVADAYHGVGVMFCVDGRRPVTVADAYHGVGVAVCV